MDPITLSGLGAVALTEGIRFLYGQAVEVLKQRRERKAGDAPVVIRSPEVLAGELEPVTLDVEAVDRLEDDVKALAGRLGNYANGLDEVDPEDPDILRATDALRQALEVIYGQRITFRGEERPSSGTAVRGRVEVDTVAGYAAAVRAETVASGDVHGEVAARRVERGGELIGIDVKRIGGDRDG